MVLLFGVCFFLNFLKLSAGKEIKHIPIQFITAILLGVHRITYPAGYPARYWKKSGIRPDSKNTWPDRQKIILITLSL